MIRCATFLDLPPLDEDVVAVEIDGVTFLETPERAAQLIAEGRGRPAGNDAPEQQGCPRPEGRRVPPHTP